jgi:hypothetical protein
MTLGASSRGVEVVRWRPVRTTAHDVQYALYALFLLCIRDSPEIIERQWQYLATGRDILERRRLLTRKRCAWTQATIPAGTSTGFPRST